VFFTNPAGYEYIHVNNNNKFTSHHAKLDDAVAEYLADPDRDLSLEEVMRKNLIAKSEQQAKVFVQVYLKGVKPTVWEMKVLVQKFMRIDKYSSNEFAVIQNITEPYEYIHLNEHVKFTSEHVHISEAIKAYLVSYTKSELTLREPYELDYNSDVVIE
jgi:hypothetical protein